MSILIEQSCLVVKVRKYVFGLLQPIQEQASPKIVDQTSKTLYAFNLDGFNDAVTDFERTLQRSKNKNKHNLPDVTAVSGQWYFILTFRTFSRSFKLIAKLNKHDT